MRLLTTALALSLAACLTALAGREVEFGPYRIILERKPFGRAPEKPVPLAEQAPDPAESFLRHIRMCAIQEDEGGVRVGLIDLKANRSHFLRPGETGDGIELVEADFDAKTAVLRRDGEEGEVEMAEADDPLLTMPRQAAKRKVTRPEGISMADRIEQRRKKAARKGGR